MLLSCRCAAVALLLLSRRSPCAQGTEVYAVTGAGGFERPGVNSSVAVHHLIAAGWMPRPELGFHYTDTLGTGEAVFSKRFAEAGASFRVSQDGAGWQGVFLIW